MEKHPVVEAQALPLSAETINQVVNSIELRVSPSPSKIPYGGFSPSLGVTRYSNGP